MATVTPLADPMEANAASAPCCDPVIRVDGLSHWFGEGGAGTQAIADGPLGLAPIDARPVGPSLGSVCIARRVHLTFPSVSSPCNSLSVIHQAHVSPLAGWVAPRSWPYPPGYGFPAPFGRRRSLLGPSCPRCGVPPSFRRSSGLLDLRPDRNGIAAFRTSELRYGWMFPVLRGRWCPNARSGAVSRHGRSIRLLVVDPLSP